MTNHVRNIVRKELLKHFEPKESKKIETKIFELCIFLSKEYDDSLDELYQKIAYDKLGELLTNPAKKMEIILDINNQVIGWKSCSFKTFRDNESKDANEQVIGMKVSKGEFKCKNSRCKSDECYYYAVQTRSCDEGATNYVVCSKCGGRYTFN